MYMIYIVIEATIVSMQSYCNGQPTEQLILILLFRRFSGTDSEAQWPPIPLHLMAAIWDGKVGRQEPNKHEGSYVLSRTRSQCHMQRTPTAVQTLRKTEGHKWGSEMCRIVSFCGCTHCAMGQRALESVRTDRSSGRKSAREVGQPSSGISIRVPLLSAASPPSLITHHSPVTTQ
jgi:hypothetical protein